MDLEVCGPKNECLTKSQTLGIQQNSKRGSGTLPCLKRLQNLFETIPEYTRPFPIYENNIPSKILIEPKKIFKMKIFGDLPQEFW